MPKSIALLAVTLLFITTGAAQEKKESTCRFRFAVSERNGFGRLEAWPEDARQWWSKDGKKKFPELCEAASQEADFVIAWGRKQATEKYRVPRHEDTPTYGWSSANVDCYTGTDGETFCRPALPPVALPEWEEHEGQVERISVTVCRVRKDQF